MVVTRNELWFEFKKAIDYGNFTKFKTKQGMNRFLNQCIRKHPGKTLRFKFMTASGEYLECVLSCLESGWKVQKSGNPEKGFIEQYFCKP